MHFMELCNCWNIFLQDSEWDAGEPSDEDVNYVMDQTTCEIDFGVVNEGIFLNSACV